MVQTTREPSDRAQLDEAGVPDQVRRLTQLVTACELLDEPESVLAEFEPRLESILARLWNDAPLTEFHQKSSVGAYLVSRYAVAWVPDGLSARRHAPLARERLVEALTEAGLRTAQAEALVGSWRSAGDAPPPEDQTLDIGAIAGLAERSLTGPERDAALHRVAWSPRDLARVVASAKLVDRIRCALPWAPPRDLSAGFAIAAADVPFRQPRRRLRLLEPLTDPWVRAVVELAAAEDALRRGDGPALAEMRQQAEDEPDTADLPERNTRDDLPALTTAEAMTDPRGSCLGLRPRRGGLYTHPVPGSDVGEGALLATVRAIRLSALAAAEGLETRDVKSHYWNRRLEGLALAASGRFDDAHARLEREDPERRWVEPLRLRGFDEVPRDACRHQAAELVRDLSASLLLAISGNVTDEAE
jgi:hypothetical protein